MRENIGFWPASQIQTGPVRQKVKTRLRQSRSAFPFEPNFQLIL